MVHVERPETLAEASALAIEHGDEAKFVSGGTAVVLMLTQGLIYPRILISLDGLHTAADAPGWTSVWQDNDDIVIGAGVTLSQVAGNSLVRGCVPSLSQAASVVGNIRIRNVATLGGNVAEADYASDPPSVLVSLGASIEVVGPNGLRRVPAQEIFQDFYTTSLTEGEVITAIRVPRRTDVSTQYLKFRSRSAEDRPCVGVATVLGLDADGVVTTLEVAVGAVCSVPQRFHDTLAQHLGRRWGAEIIDHVAHEYARRIAPIDDARGSRTYRTRLVSVLIRRSLMAVLEEQETRRGE